MECRSTFLLLIHLVSALLNGGFMFIFYTLPLPQRIEIAFNMTDWRFGWGVVTSDSLLTLALEKLSTEDSLLNHKDHKS